MAGGAQNRIALLRRHFAKTTVKIHAYPDGTLAVLWDRIGWPITTPGAYSVCPSRRPHDLKKIVGDIYRADEYSSHMAEKLGARRQPCRGATSPARAAS
jgi:hypothetical protein